MEGPPDSRRSGWAELSTLAVTLCCVVSPDQMAGGPGGPEQVALHAAPSCCLKPSTASLTGSLPSPSPRCLQPELQK